VALVFAGVFGGLLWRFPVVGIVVTVVGRVQSSFLLCCRISGYCGKSMHVLLHVVVVFAALGVLGRPERFVGSGSVFPHVRRRHLFH